ncbi:helix-turn-helix domain-containing protein [Nocardioides sp. YIM 152315]|uniref:helix-turn-helix domain-containing protein n=1 Tax=Nocardioides sp. YIM 152315 TaxID=3031760 RepID=UPI0023DC20CD|nr:helix-turn-helix domain-containing protein [Nocardioides sp. YIM 152315]MDF1605067.1 helix-turn-helix domain-containing protein [Nocardioides sp. YIM 152315]
MATYDDPRILRAIAHPTRNRILAELHASGSIRAADVARMLDIPANQASFHLRQLAKYGVVEEAPDEARDRRDRVWRLVDADGIRFRTQDLLDQPGGEAAWEVFRRNAVAWGHFLVDQALGAPDPDNSRSLTDSSLRLSKDEADELLEELGAVVQRWRARTQGTGDGRVTYSVYQLIQPYPVPAGTAEDA